MDTPEPARPQTQGFAPRFTIGQLMLVILVAGLAFAPAAMYLQESRVELIVAMVAFETIGLPMLVTLLLLATMEPGKARTRRVLILSSIPTLLIIGAFGLAQVSGLLYGFATSLVDVAHGNPKNLIVFLIVAAQAALQVRICLPPRCPGCRAFKLRLDPSTARSWARRSTESFNCVACHARSSRITYWGCPGRLGLVEAGSPGRPDVLFVETHDS